MSVEGVNEEQHISECNWRQRRCMNNQVVCRKSEYRSRRSNGSGRIMRSQQQQQRRIHVLFSLLMVAAVESFPTQSSLSIFRKSLHPPTEQLEHRKLPIANVLRDPTKIGSQQQEHEDDDYAVKREEESAEVFSIANRKRNGKQGLPAANGFAKPLERNGKTVEAKNGKRIEPRNGKTVKAVNGKFIEQRNGFNGKSVEEPPPRNGKSVVLSSTTLAAVERRQEEQGPRNGKAVTSTAATAAFGTQPATGSIAPTAPEVTHWTEIMSRGWKKEEHTEFSPSSETASPSDELYTSKSNKWYYLTGVLSDFDLQEIEKYWDRLLPAVSYLGTAQAAMAYKALCVAYRAHRGQCRKSGEPFIIHPVEVALLLADLKMDADTIVAGLLHDTVEDTDLTFTQLESLFGQAVRSIVEGETKVSKLPKLGFTDYADEQAENLRQMFVAMTEDYRIIIVKLADRLHNMRTLRFMKPAKQVKISRETLDIFAPLAHRMGIWQFKSELEDTAFMYLYPAEYKRLNRRLRQHQRVLRETLDKSQVVLQRQLGVDPTLQQQAAKVEVFGRTKEIYSLWHKMESKGIVDLDHITDVVALRVVITPKAQQGGGGATATAAGSSAAVALPPGSPGATIFPAPNHNGAVVGGAGSGSSPSATSSLTSDPGVWLCYHVLGLVQHLPGFQPVPTRVKDYISFPKPNGYQSLHTAVLLDGQTIEVQIRTNAMHQVAEYGMASHWAYTDGKRKQDRAKKLQDQEELYNTPWLSSIKDWQNDRISSRDFVDSVRRELLGKRVFVFLRNGKILNLARGATAIDAAFQIHTEIGIKMEAVEINGRQQPFSYELQNGDVVSIHTGPNGKPATDWMRYAKSRSTRSKLRAYFRARQKESFRDAGKILLLDYLQRHRELIEEHHRLPKPVKQNSTGTNGENRFCLPRTVEGLSAFLPGKTGYTDMGELLVLIGKPQRDRTFLHRIVSQLFGVPKRLLAKAEAPRRSGYRGGTAAAAAAVLSRQQQLDAEKSKLNQPENGSKNQEKLDTNATCSSCTCATPWEYADPEHLCQTCLPVRGDEIVGTRTVSSDSDSSGAASAAMVHRIGCPHAQQVLNQAAAGHKLQALAAALQEQQQKKSSARTPVAPPPPRVDSVSLRKRSYIWYPNAETGYRSKNAATVAAEANTRNHHEVPVQLRWSNVDNDIPSSGSSPSVLPYLAEVVVHAADRKLLLADCSEVVSETVEIVKTGSSSSDQHATLVFFVRVDGLDQLQLLMDRLSGIASVMSVERRFGSELM